MVLGEKGEGGRTSDCGLIASSRLKPPRNCYLPSDENPHDSTEDLVESAVHRLREFSFVAFLQLLTTIRGGRGKGECIKRYVKVIDSVSYPEIQPNWCVGVVNRYIKSHYAFLRPHQNQRDFSENK